MWQEKTGIIPIMHNCVLYKIRRPIIISHYNHWQTKHSVVMLLLLGAVSFPLSLRMADHAWWTVTMWHWWPPVHTHTHSTERERKRWGMQAWSIFTSLGVCFTPPLSAENRTNMWRWNQRQAAITWPPALPSILLSYNTHTHVRGRGMGGTACVNKPDRRWDETERVRMPFQ